MEPKICHQKLIIGKNWRRFCHVILTLGNTGEFYMIEYFSTKIVHDHDWILNTIFSPDVYDIEQKSVLNCLYELVLNELTRKSMSLFLP